MACRRHPHVKSEIIVGYVKGAARGSMRVMMVDPLFTTMPYDKCLCAALAQAGHQVCIVAKPQDKQTWDIPCVEHVCLNVADLLEPSSLSGARLRILSAWRHLSYGLKIQSISALARKWQADVVHFQWCLSPLAELLLLRRLRHGTILIYTVHDTVPFNGSRMSSFMTLGLGALMKRFDRLIVHTDAAKNVLIAQGLDGTSIFTVPHGPLGLRAKRNGGDLQVADRKATSDQKGSQKVEFLLFGGMKEYKGIDVLIAAAGLLPKPIRDRCRFKVAGEPAVDLKRLMDLCKEAQVEEAFEFDARFFRDEEMDLVLEGADVFLFPYRRIEASGVFSMAIQYGRPFIASDIGIFKEKVIHGCHGWLVAPESPQDLANAIARAVLEPIRRLEMGANVERMRESLPMWDHIAAATDEVYKQRRPRDGRCD